MMGAVVDLDETAVDVAVIGAGLAGSIAACLLARAGTRVILVDRERNKSFKIGETLAGEAQAILVTHQLNAVIEQVERLESSGKRSIWGSTRLIERSGILNPYGGGWHLDRAAFDVALLREAIKAGAAPIAPASLEQIERAAHGWTMFVKSREMRHRVSAKTIIDASGRSRFFARKQGIPQIVYDALVGCYRVFQTTSAIDSDLSTTIESESLGWWYSSRIPGQRRVVVFFTDRDLMRRSRWSGNSWEGSLRGTAIIQGLIRDHGYQWSAKLARNWPIRRGWPHRRERGGGRSAMRRLLSIRFLPVA